MGFNTTVLILNDRLGEIENDAEFGKKLVAAIQESWGGAKHSYLTGQTTVVSQTHSSETAIVAVGGNCASLLAVVPGCNHGKPEFRKEAARAVRDGR